ncbi:MAG TPA: NADPH-dependent assimilatory sulfite reductase hemoprotein subunit [Stellaceae bacterium]|nr:NADPH-dependent assimilatory sulfite reductase hemoprotein subunit [Stellaceae bacterium]
MTELVDEPVLSPAEVSAENSPPRGLKPQTKVEAVKAASRHLRGSIAAGLAEGGDRFGGGDPQLLKFHGIYEGYDRDSATALKQRGEQKRAEFMARVKLPAGQLSAEQYLALDALGQRYGGDQLRITTRQGIQFHGVIKRDLKATIAEINAALMTTFGACGDVVRNVTASPAPIADAVHRRLQRDAILLSEALTPRTRGYHEIWIDDERVDEADAQAIRDEADPLYGETYLPRKFKIGLAVPEDNWVDVLTNDLGIIALFEGDHLIGYNLAVGGGLGMTHNKPATYPRLATPVAFVEPDQLLAAVKAVIGVQRDHGDRANRKHARLKYLVDERGLAWIKAAVERHLGHPVAPPRPMPKFAVRDHMGWHEQGDGNWYYGLPIPSGRIIDNGEIELTTALRQVFQTIPCRPILTPTQDMLIADIAPADRARVIDLLKLHGVTPAEAQSPVERWALACPALPTCGLALTEAERARGEIIGPIEAALRRHGLGEERLAIRITGCPNGCARPYAGDIGIVGRMPGYYAIFLGGDFEGTRLNTKAFERVALTDISAVLEPIFGRFAAERLVGEGFGDFCHRIGVAELTGSVPAQSDRKSG